MQHTHTHTIRSTFNLTCSLYLWKQISFWILCQQLYKTHTYTHRLCARTNEGVTVNMNGADDLKDLDHDNHFCIVQWASLNEANCVVYQRLNSMNTNESVQHINCVENLPLKITAQPSVWLRRLDNRVDIPQPIRVAPIDMDPLM